MANISVIDGTLYQWNSGRKIRIVPRQGETINRVHYNNGNVVFLSEDGDSIVAPIPNILLKSSQNITAYVEVVSAEGVRTVSDCTFSVIAKPKPDDYVYEETEVLTIEAVVENALNEAKESGVFKGDPGEKGEQGIQGIQGEKGDVGSAGKDGYTPKKGTDYWTEADKNEIKEELSGNYVTNAVFNQNMELIGKDVTQMRADISSINANIGNMTVHLNENDIRLYNLENNIGDIETALDRILEMQNELVGGDAS